MDMDLAIKLGLVTLLYFGLVVGIQYLRLVLYKYKPLRVIVTSLFELAVVLAVWFFFSVRFFDCNQYQGAKFNGETGYMLLLVLLFFSMLVGVEEKPVVFGRKKVYRILSSLCTPAIIVFSSEYFFDKLGIHLDRYGFDLYMLFFVLSTYNIKGWKEPNGRYKKFLQYTVLPLVILIAVTLSFKLKSVSRSDYFHQIRLEWAEGHCRG